VRAYRCKSSRPFRDSQWEGVTTSRERAENVKRSSGHGAVPLRVDAAGEILIARKACLCRGRVACL
jgi:hypothetical protein